MARTKQTAANPKMNGTPKPPKDESSVKSPAQPTELSDADRTKIKNWLDKQEKPFGVATVPLSRKRKRQSGGLQTQSDLFDDRLSIQYEVKPRDKWECLRRYKKFTVGSESIAVGQCILVKHDDSEEAKIDITSQWKAKVLEVRALDSEHVYIRVAWLNRPEDLDSGRKAYHGKNELIPTNQMDVIDAMAVNGSLEVEHWDERDDDIPLMNEEQYFWRQTYDFANTKTFSELRLICKDLAPQNPDEMILQCGSKDCSKWLHVKCIAEEAVREAAEDASDEQKRASKRQKLDGVKIGARSLVAAKAQKDGFTAEMFVKGSPDDDAHTPAEKTEIIITDTEGEKHTQGVACLFCGTEIE